MPMRKDFINLDADESNRILEWRNHPDVRKWMFDSDVIPAAHHIQFLGSLRSNNGARYWAVSDVGVISLTRISHSHKHAYLGIYANLSNNIRGKGSILMRELLEAAFLELELNTLKLEVFASNIAAIKLYQRWGFVVEGELKEYVLRNGQFENVIVMGLLNRAAKILLG